jgi:hypothetical protein
MKRTRIRPVSKKRRARIREVQGFRKGLIEEVGRCEVCGHNPDRMKTGHVQWTLVVHEIARGEHREKALDQRCAVLVLCWRCHAERIHGPEEWPQARQLAVLRRSRPEDYDLEGFNALVGYGPRRITDKEVERWSTDSTLTHAGP